MTASRPTVLYLTADPQVSTSRPLRFSQPPGLVYVRAHCFGVDALLNPNDEQIERVAATADGPIFLAFEPESVGAAIQVGRRLRRRDKSVTAINASQVPDEGVDAFTSLWPDSSLRRLWDEASIQINLPARAPPVGCRALSCDGTTARLTAVLSHAPDPASLSVEAMMSETPVSTSIASPDACDASGIVACFNGPVTDTFIDLVARQPDLVAIAGKFDARVAALASERGCVAYTWFEPEHLDWALDAPEVAGGVAYVPIGHPDLDLPETISHVLRLRDCGYDAVVPRFWIPQPRGTQWEELAQRYGFRDPLPTTLDGQGIVFDLPSLAHFEGPELLALITKGNAWPTLPGTASVAPGVSLRDVHRVIQLYSSGLEAGQHRADLIYEAAAELPELPPAHAVERTDQYPFLSLDGRDPCALLNRAMSERLRGDASVSPAVFSAMQQVVRAGGKRIRGVLSLALWTLNALPTQAAYRVATAIEWLHAASLIQDDLPAMDNEHWRRGEVTAHRKHGEASALLASDALVMLAFEDLTRTAEDLGADAALQLVSAATRAVGRDGLVGGQSRDLELGRNTALSTDDLLAIHMKKTAPLFGLVARCTGIAADFDSDRVERFESALGGLGVAFQIVDDLIDDRSGKRRMSSSDRRNDRPSFATIMSNESAVRLAENYLRPLQTIVAAEPALAPLGRLIGFVVGRTH